MIALTKIIYQGWNVVTLPHMGSCLGSVSLGVIPKKDFSLMGMLDLFFNSEAYFSPIRRTIICGVRNWNLMLTTLLKGDWFIAKTF